MPRRGRHAVVRKPGPVRRALLRPQALMAAGTVVSRATGLIRQVLQAGALGTGLLATTYNQANTVPASLYFLVVGGALNSVLVPQLVRARLEQPDGGRAFEQRLVTLTLSVLGAATLIAVWAAPQIIGVYQRDTPAGHAAFQLTVAFARFLLPQIFFYGLYGILGQVLNARNRFGAMMWTPVLNNVLLIAVFGWYAGLMTAAGGVHDITRAQVTLLGTGTTLALAVQALALVPYVRAAGFRFRPRFDWRGTGMRASVASARWTLLFVLANLVAATLVTRYATAADRALPRAGVGFTAYSYAQTIWSLPQSVVTVSLVTALLPRMSRAVAEHREDDMRRDLSRTLRTSGAVIVPAAFFFLALGPQLAQLLFAHGAAAPAATRPLGRMLQAFGPGLVPFSAQYVLTRGFYAFGDTRTPFLTALWTGAVQIALATGCHLLLSPRWAVTGMAACYGVASAAGLVLTAWLLRRRLGGRLDGRRVCRTYGRLGGAALTAAAAGWTAAGLCPVPSSSPAVAAGLALAAGGGVMLLLHLLLARAWGAAGPRGLPRLRRERPVSR
ncbi:murein biosynthesis integral membrane protein MurJ [Streptomyces sp. NBC_00388]|uniref:murein biosynthesis integral membrane protein MurJ n=1 Tax=Streptomyces sp. NBC_00388 TaxID=2975735 RepID=UPI003FA7434C